MYACFFCAFFSSRTFWCRLIFFSRRIANRSNISTFSSSEITIVRSRYASEPCSIAF